MHSMQNEAITLHLKHVEIHSKVYRIKRIH